MNRDWERTFNAWAGGPGSTEERHCENAISAIRDAINESRNLRFRNIDVFLQGSYRNRVNVRQNSDVDVGIVCHETFFYRLPETYTSDHFGITPATYSYLEFKKDIEQALVSHFGLQSIHRGNKAFDIRGNTYRVEADVAPFFDHRRYDPSTRYLERCRAAAGQWRQRDQLARTAL